MCSSTETGGSIIICPCGSSSCFFLLFPFRIMFQQVVITVHYPVLHLHGPLWSSKYGSEVDTENTGSDVDGKENVCDGDGIENGGGIGEVIVKFYE
ncbi:hypothetical protein Tco_0974815 [Tanacetum coccineum]|uniref:Uncharacterized protein n=1 Tax=Tanacetum coccineum TaxID=301880 RepID=A0ABQ5ECP2_9ASTR